PPLDLGDPAVLRPQPQALGTMTQHRHDVAVVADLALAPVDRAPGTPEQAELVARRDRQVVGLPALVDGAIDGLVAADLAAILQPPADRLADLRHIVVRRRAHGDRALRAGPHQHVA